MSDVMLVFQRCDVSRCRENTVAKKRTRETTEA